MLMLKVKEKRRGIVSASKHSQEYFRKHSEEYRKHGEQFTASMKRYKPLYKISLWILAGLVLLIYAMFFGWIGGG